MAGGDPGWLFGSPGGSRPFPLRRHILIPCPELLVVRLNDVPHLAGVLGDLPVLVGFEESQPGPGRRQYVFKPGDRV